MKYVAIYYRKELAFDERERHWLTVEGSHVELVGSDGYMPLQACTPGSALMEAVAFGEERNQRLDRGLSKVSIHCGTSHRDKGSVICQKELRFCN